LLPSELDRRRVLGARRRLGFVASREAGRHTILLNPDLRVSVAVPRHARVRRGTVRGELRRAGIEPDEFMDYY
jgi:predicted RNA binding protein YcfA (HicA-like mRNA interferase family)